MASDAATQVVPQGTLDRVKKPDAIVVPQFKGTVDDKRLFGWSERKAFIPWRK